MALQARSDRYKAAAESFREANHESERLDYLARTADEEKNFRDWADYTKEYEAHKENVLKPAAKEYQEAKNAAALTSDIPMLDVWGDHNIKRMLDKAATENFTHLALADGRQIAKSVSGPEDELAVFYDSITDKKIRELTKSGKAQLPPAGGSTPDDLLDGLTGEVIQRAHEGKFTEYDVRPILPGIRKEGQRLYKTAEDGAKLGATEFGPTGKATITAFEGADASTMFHEFGHLFRKTVGDASPDLIKRFEDELGVVNGVWDRAAEERFAESYEAYRATGEAPTSTAKAVFNAFAGFAKKLVGQADATPKGPPVHGLFEEMLGQRLPGAKPTAGILPGVGAQVARAAEAVPEGQADEAAAVAEAVAPRKPLEFMQFEDLPDAPRPPKPPAAVVADPVEQLSELDDLRERIPNPYNSDDVELLTGLRHPAEVANERIASLEPTPKGPLYDQLRAEQEDMLRGLDNEAAEKMGYEGSTLARKQPLAEQDMLIEAAQIGDALMSSQKTNCSLVDARMARCQPKPWWTRPSRLSLTLPTQALILGPS